MNYSAGGDTLSNVAVIKAIIDNGWYLNNPALGMPLGAHFQDFPVNDTVHLVIIKGLSLLASRPGVVINLFFLLTFPATALTALYVLRRLGLSWLAAVPSCLLYTFLPYHFIRGESHLFLASYYLVPLVVLVCLAVCQTSAPGTERGTAPVGFIQPRLPILAGITICALVGSANAYYAFFSAFLMLASAGISAVNSRSFRGFRLGFGYLGVIAFSFFLGELPNLLFFLRNGNVNAAVRSVGDAEVYGLKIAQLLLPVPRHRLHLLAHLNDLYTERAPRLLINENVSVSLGLLGSIGFLGLLCATFGSRRRSSLDSRLVADLSRLNLAVVLLATVGGLGSIVAQLPGASNIRAYNRVVVFVAFFSFAGVALGLEAVRWRWAGRFGGAWAFPLLMGSILAVGLLDQTSPALFTPSYRRDISDFQSDEGAVRHIESVLPAGAMIFQLPVVAFPKGEPRLRMAPHDAFRGYLHSTTLRWSFGATFARPCGRWQAEVEELPAGQMLEKLAHAGFRGVLVDRYGYADSGDDAVRQISSAAEGEPYFSANKRFAFVDLSAYGRRLREREGPMKWRRTQEDVLAVISGAR
jgi:phosphoglycerol transferase